VQEPHWAFCSRGKSYSTWGIELWCINCTACSPINISTTLSWPVIWFASYLQDMQISSICSEITITKYDLCCSRMEKYEIQDKASRQLKWHSQYSNSLRAGQSGDQILVGGEISTTICISYGTHPASCAMGTRSFIGLKWPGAWHWLPIPSSAGVKKKGGAILLLPLWAFMACCRVNFIKTKDLNSYLCKTTKFMHISVL